jgi:hypothetical protein
MNRRRRWAVLLVALALACGRGGGGMAPTAALDLEALLPADASSPGWRLVDGPTAHGPDTLFEYLNGGAERYVEHGFRRLVHARYQRGDDPLACVTIDVFDMGEPLGAFGIYSAGRDPEWEPHAWGVDGYRHGPVAAAWKGPVFVHGVADDDRPELIAVLERVVAHVADAAPGDPAGPAMIDVLPTGHLVPRSERYVARDLLGHAFLPGGLLATYADGERSSELFVSDLGGVSEAADALAALRDHVARWGELVPASPPPGDDGFRYVDPVLGPGLAMRSGGHVAGIHGGLPPELHDEIAARLVERVSDQRGQP